MTDQTTVQQNKPNYGIEKTLSRLMENIAFYLTMLIIMYFMMICTEILSFHKKLIELGQTTSYSELLFFPLGYLFKKGILFLCSFCLTGFLKKNLVDKKFRDETEEKRLERLMNYMSSIIYNTLAFIIGIYITKGTDLCPKFFGGELDNSKFVEFWPKDVPAIARIFFLFQFAHHFERLTNLFLKKKGSSDFFTMNLHHFLTIFLMIASYFMQQLHYGVPVLIINDLSDIFLNSTKLFREIKILKFLFNINFILLWTTWLYTRIFVYTIEILRHLEDLLVKPSPMIREFHYAFLFQLISLHLLGILNYYWCFMISKLLYNKIFKGSERITVEGEGEEKDKRD